MRKSLPRWTTMGRLKAVVTLSLLFAASSAQAATVTYNPAGGGTVAGSVQVATFDELPGNALALNGQAVIDAAVALANSTGVAQVSSPFTLLYQANVRLLDANGNTIDTGNNVITAISRFNETATVNPSNSASAATVTFNLSANQAGSYFDLFVHPNGVIGNNIAGTGFGPDNGGVLIYSATPPTSGFSGNFTNTDGSQPLDQSSNPNPALANQKTVGGSGGSQLIFTSNFVNSNYFIGNFVNSTISFDTNNNLPFRTVSATSSFEQLNGSGLAGAVLGASVTPVLGPLNGAPGGRDVQFLADASSTISAVPEPASVVMTLLGLSGAGLVGFASRRRAARA